MTVDRFGVSFLLLLGVAVGVAWADPCTWLEIAKGWRTGYRAQVDIPMENDMEEWMVVAHFDEEILSFQSWKGTVAKIGASNFSISSKCYNGQLFSCQCLSLSFLVKHNLDTSPYPTFSFNGQAVKSCNQQPCNNQTKGIITESKETGSTTKLSTSTTDLTTAPLDPEYYMVVGGISKSGKLSSSKIYSPTVPIRYYFRPPSLPVAEGVSGGVGGVVGDVVVQCSGSDDRCWYWEPLLTGASWKTAPPDRKRAYGAGVSSNGQLWVSGGLPPIDSSPLSTSLYQFTGSGVVRTAGPDLSQARIGHCGADYMGGVILTGGFGKTYLKLVEKYDIMSGTVESLPHLNWPRMNHGCTVYGDTAIVAAGWLWGIYINIVEVLKPGQTWKIVQPLENVRLNPQMVSLGRFPYIVGGAWYDKSSKAWNYRDLVFKYDENLDEWMEEDKLKLPEGVFRHTLIKIPHRLLAHL